MIRVTMSARATRTRVYAAHVLQFARPRDRIANRALALLMEIACCRVVAQFAYRWSRLIMKSSVGQTSPWK